MNFYDVYKNFGNNLDMNVQSKQPAAALAHTVRSATGYLKPQHKPPQLSPVATSCCGGLSNKISTNTINVIRKTLSKQPLLQPLLLP